MNIHTPTCQNRSLYRRGFTLLFASLVASLLTALGLAMVTIAQKELVLSSLGRESGYAFYAADTGAECATYLDFHYDAFATSTPYTSDAVCAEYVVEEVSAIGALEADGVTGLGGTTNTTFQFETNDHCVLVSVQKRNAYPFTTVESFGYNTSCAQGDSPRKLERAVRAIF